MFRRGARALLVACALLVAGCAGATREGPGSRAASANAPRTRPLMLWRVTGPAGVAPSYLFGTCHLGVTLDRALPSSQRAALDGARVVALEVDIAAVDPRAMLRRTLLPPDASLREMVGEQTWRRLVRRPPLAQLPWLVLDRFDPWVAASALMSAEVQGPARPGAPGAASAPQGMDAVILSQARARNTRLVFLETVDEQLQMLAGLPRAMSIEALRAFASPRSPAHAMLQSVLDVCRTGDTRGVDAARAHQQARGSAVLDAMLDTRTRAWVPRVQALVAEGGAFIAAGAGHMVGPSGLVALLRARGLSVEQVEVPLSPGEARVAGTAGDERASDAGSDEADGAAGPASHDEAEEPVATASGDAGASNDAGAPGGATAGLPRDAFVTRLADAVVANVCREGGFGLSCFDVDAARCVALLRRGFQFCADEHAAELPAAVTSESAPQVGQAIGDCAGRGWESVLRLEGRFRETPRCNDPSNWRDAPSAPSQPPPSAPTGPARRGGRRGH